MFRNEILIIPESMAQDFGTTVVLEKQAHSRLRNCFSGASVASKDKSGLGIIEFSFLRLLLVLLLNSYVSHGWASNSLREMEYAEEVEASLSKGQVIWLKAKGERFLTLYTETEEVTNSGTAIILHPVDGHPNQEKLIKPLRTFLPEHNWATLAIQLPVLGVGAEEHEYYPLFDDANTRIQAAIDHLLTGGVNNIVLIGYGLGGMMAIYYLKENVTARDVKAIVAISLPVPKTEYKQVQVIDFIADIRQPFLDIFAEYDLSMVTDTARKRRVSAKQNVAYRQVEIEGEGHLFQHDEGLVVKRIYSWINRTFKQLKR